MPHREATRLISYSQAGAGAFLLRVPDVSLVKGSIVTSTGFRTVIQRRLGLYVSCLADVLDERSHRRVHVTQHDRLGDAAINDANNTHRHNAGVQAVYTALRCASNASDSIRLGDKGDGTPASKAESARQHAWLNDGHIPDIYELGPPHCLHLRVQVLHPLPHPRRTRSRLAAMRRSSIDLRRPLLCIRQH